MKTLYLVGAVLSGVLAVAPAQADQRAKVRDSRADFHALSAIPARLSQFDDGQMREVEGGVALSTVVLLVRLTPEQMGRRQPLTF